MPSPMPTSFPLRAAWLVPILLVFAGCSDEYPNRTAHASGGTVAKTASQRGGNAAIGGGAMTAGTRNSVGTAQGGSGAAGRSVDTNVASTAAGQAATGGAFSNAGGSAMAGAAVTHWVGTWATAQQLTETTNNPPSPGLATNTLRQVVRVSIGGKLLRLRLSNEYSTRPVTLNAVHCALSVGGSSIATNTDTELRFSGQGAVTIPAKQFVWSDPFSFDLSAMSKLAISIYFGATPPDVTGHPGSRTTSYVQSGNGVAAASMTSASTADHWYIISGLDVAAEADSRAVVILGDSITDGRGSTTNGNDRWPDALTDRLQRGASKVAVLNQGIGGNAVVSGGLGPTALLRFDGDVINQSGVRWLIVLEGVNDIGGASSQVVATNLINAYKVFVTKAHLGNLLAYGVPILPFGGSSYDSVEHETARQTVNAWIRTAGNFDAVIDLDAAVRDPNVPSKLLSVYDSGDHLHLNPAGYKKMAEAVDLTLLSH